MKTLSTACLSFVFLVSSATISRAEQFVLFDTTFTFTKDDADNSRPSPSHYYVKSGMLNAERPKDWTAPVDYRNGTVHVRLEVLEKPEGDEPTTWSVCDIPVKRRNGGYGCLGTNVYKAAGVYEKDIEMTKFWQNDGIVWSEGVKEMHLVIKDNSGGQGHAHKRADHEKFFPTKIRMTIIQVSKGAKYDPTLVPHLPPVPDVAIESDGQPADQKKQQPEPSRSTGSSASLDGCVDGYALLNELFDPRDQRPRVTLQDVE